MNTEKALSTKTPALNAGVFFKEEHEEKHEDSWKESMRSAFKNSLALEVFLNQKIAQTSFPLFVPHKLAKKIKNLGPMSALWKQFIPSHLENNSSGLIDPIGDQKHSQGSQIIHRYQNRVLFMPTSVCPVMCRYCFRKNELTENLDFLTPDFEKTLQYLNSHTEINEVIFSGGDPFILTDEKLDFYLSAFSKIPHLKYIRFHTRTPIVMPERVTAGLIEVLTRHQASFSKLFIALHINHMEELDPEVEDAICRLSEHRIELLSQTVLLKGINDDVSTLKELLETLVDMNVRPYYLHHPDPVKGGSHFMLTLKEGRTIYGKLRDLLPGWALPQYIIDIPEGFGKVLAFNGESLDFGGYLLSRELKTIPYKA
ncbi:MAG: KamA family radical SAM protein [Bacteriovoracaceae bacterium]